MTAQLLGIDDDKSLSGSQPSRSAISIIAVCAGLASALASFVLFGKSGPDDSYITNWAALGLANSGSITNYNGQIFEQSTSLLHVVTIGSTRFLTGLPVPLIGYLLGLIGIVLTVVMASALARRLDIRAAIPATLFVAAAYPLLYWGGSGLETTLVPPILILFLIKFESCLRHFHEKSTKAVFLSRDALWLLLATLLACAIRPDTMVVVVAIAGTAAAVATAQSFLRPSVTLLPSINRRSGALSLAIVGLGFSMIEGFRLIYFGKLFPAPVYAKTGFSLQVDSGWHYITSSLPSPILWVPVVALALVGAWRLAKAASLAGWLTIVCAVYLFLLVLFSGGDWMGWARMLVSPTVFALILAACGVSYVRTLIGQRFPNVLPGLVSGRVVTAALVCIVLSLEILVLSVKFSAPRDNGEVYVGYAPIWTSWRSVTKTGTTLPIQPALPFYEARNVAHTRDVLFVRTLEPALRDLAARLRQNDPNRIITIASPQAGLNSYYLFQDIPGLKFIDRLGLTTDSFSTCSGLKRSPFGASVTDQFWIANAGKCAPELPDILISNAQIRGPLSNSYTTLVNSQLTFTRDGLPKPYKTVVVAAVNKRDTTEAEGSTTR